MLNPGGVMVVATLNRTLKSLLFAKIAGEYILRLLPPWDARRAPLHHAGGTGGGAGSVRRPGRGAGRRRLQSLPRRFRITAHLGINYMAVARRPAT
jgi:2-polyprenyl-6-hydroxyphenyl methylase/3-demethylubiquinone-9 3-methyltransferase